MVGVAEWIILKSGNAAGYLEPPKFWAGNPRDQYGLISHVHFEADVPMICPWNLPSMNRRIGSVPETDLPRPCIGCCHAVEQTIHTTNIQISSIQHLEVAVSRNRLLVWLLKQRASICR